MTVRLRPRLVAATISLLALAALGRTAGSARARILADADERTARIAAGYLAVLASASRADRSPPEMRLLSAAGSLANSRSWGAGTQIWLRGTPLLSADTTGRRASVATFAVGDSVDAGSVAVWASVPPDRGLPLAPVGAGFAFAALVMITCAGEFMRLGRIRAVVVAAGLCVVGTGALGQAREVYATWGRAQDSGLLRARRTLEITAVGRRLRDEEVDAMSGGLHIAALRAQEAIRDSAVVQDSGGAHISAVAARGQAWQLTAPAGVERYATYWRLLLGWGMLALLSGFVAAALPPSARYLSASRPASSTPT